MTANVTLTNYLLLKRANTSVSSTYTGLVGEITIDTDLDTIRVHDGVTAGGHLLANVSQINDSGNVSAINANVAAANIQIDNLRANVTAANVQITALFANAAAQQIQINNFAANTGFATLDQLTANVNTINANIGAFQTFSNANAGTQATSINNLDANIGAYQIYANANVVAVQANLGAYQIYANANVVAIQANLGAYQIYANANAVAQANELNNMTANAGVQATAINQINANISAANAAITALTANAATQAGFIITVNANVSAANAAIASLQSNASVQQGVLDVLSGNAVTQTLELQQLTSNAAVQAANLTVLLANASAQEASLTVLVSNAASQATAIDNINANLGAYQTYANANAASQATNITTLLSNAAAQAQSLDSLTTNAATQGASIISIDANLGVATTNITALQSNAGAQGAAIDSINANVGAYQTFANANAAVQAGSLTTLLANAAAQAQSLDSLVSNAATQAASINTIDANLGSATTNITSLQSNAGSQAAAIDSINANVGAYQTYANANAATQATSIATLTANAAAQQLQIDSFVTGTGFALITQLTANVDTINANTGAFQTYANANASTQATGINTINANLGSFQTYANLHFGDSNYGNTNVAAYLGAFNGNIIPAANVTYSLGDSTHQWKDLWVSNNTIYIGNTPVRVDGGTLLVNGAPIATTVSNLVNGAYTFNLFANGQSLSPDTIFASNGVSIINANGAIQGGIYNSGDANFFNIGASTGRGIKFYVDEETDGPLFFANGSVNVPGNLYSTAGIIGDVNMYGGTIYGTNPSWNYLTLANQGEGSVFVQLPSEATANVANLRIHNDIGNVEIATGDGFSYNYWYFGNDGDLTVPRDIFGTGTNPLVIQNTSTGSAYLELPLTPGTNPVYLSNQDPAGNVVVRTGDFGSENDWTFGMDGNLTIPGNITMGPGSGRLLSVVTPEPGLVSWEFGMDGNLTIPGNINYANGVSILDGIGGAVNGNIVVGDSQIQFVANSSGDGYGLSTIRLVPYTAGYDSAIIIIDPTYPNHIHMRAGFEQDNAAANLFLGGEASHFNVEEGANPNVSIRSNYYTWTFATDGRLQLPELGESSSEIFTGSGGISIKSPQYTELRYSSTDPGNVSPTLNTEGYMWITDDGAHIQNYHGGQFNLEWLFGTDGNLTIPGNINYANGVNILSTVGAGSYGNTQVAAYLPTYTGNVGAGNVNVTSTVYAANIVTSGTSGNISGVNVISANTFVFAANGVNILYGNTQVAAYLLTWPNIDSNILNATSANITTLRAPNFNSANSVISGGYISALTNASIITATITTLNSTGGNVTTLRATNFSTANAVITGGYINSLANLTATTAVFTNLSTGNAVISGGYISALTNAYITTSAITNFSTANAVITGGYASGLANVTATGNVTAGNLIGYGSNTSIVAGAYTSTFDNVGNVILPNAYVSGNTTVMGIAPGYAPNRPAFRVYGNGAVPIWHNTANVNLKGSAITVDHNQGNYFDSTTGKFTVPVAGLYITTLQARVGDNNGLNQIAVLKNGNNSGANVVCFWETDTNTGTATHFGTSGVVVLAPGDFLSANILAGNINFDGNDSWTVTYLG